MTDDGGYSERIGFRPDPFQTKFRQFQDRFSINAILSCTIFGGTNHVHAAADRLCKIAKKPEKSATRLLPWPRGEGPSVSNEIIVAMPSEDLRLIVSALAAYQHQDRYRDLYERLVSELDKLEAPSKRK